MPLLDIANIKKIFPSEKEMEREEIIVSWDF